MKHTTIIQLSAALLLATITAPLLSAAESGSTETSIAFSRPEAPHTVRIEAMNGRITVHGADVDQVSVRASGSPAQAQPRREDGLRVIATATSFNLTERDNVVYLTQDSGSLFSGGGDFDVTVPRDSAVVVKVAINGSATVSDLTGDIEVSNLNGPVTLDNIGGGAAVDTMNGEVSVRYAALPEGKSHSFSSMNGKIALFLPAAAKASFRLRAQNGTVATDFDDKVFVTTAGTPAPGEFPGMGGLRAGLKAAGVAIDMAHNIARDAMGAPRHQQNGAHDPAPPAVPPVPKMPPHPTFPAFGGQVVTGALNGGGVEILATTMNGEIQIREAK